MPNIGNFLNNDTELMPLLKFYLQQYDVISPEKELDEEDWECIQGPDGSLTSFRLDVLAMGKAGSVNIRDGYLRTLAHCLKQGKIPDKIKVVSIINHHQVHWTSSVTEIEVDAAFFKNLQVLLEDEDVASKQIYEIINLLNSQFHPEQTASEIEIDLQLFGVKKMSVKHYDSHNADPKIAIGPYFPDYEETLTPLITTNKELDITVEPANCKQQRGNTCGDYSMWNGFTNGVLGLSLQENTLEAEELRALTEAITSDNPDEEDVILATIVPQQIISNIKVSKEKSSIHSQDSPLEQPTTEPHDRPLENTFTEPQDRPLERPTIEPLERPLEKASTEPLDRPLEKASTELQDHPLEPQDPPLEKTPEEKLVKKSNIHEIYPTKAQVSKIVFSDTVKNGAFNALLLTFGQGEQIEQNILKRYHDKKTEKGLKGIFQKFNVRYGRIFTQKRAEQISDLATIFDRLQKDSTLNNHEKGVILKGALDNIIDDITMTEAKNVFKSRLVELCASINKTLLVLGVTGINHNHAKTLYNTYLDKGAESFRKQAVELTSKSQPRLN